MFQKTKPTETASRKIAPSVISSDMNLLGNIISDGLIDFDGSIHGNISCHTLMVRQNARIHGEVKADTVQVAGHISGTVQARNVILQEGAEVEGTIMHEQITVEEGATVDGKLKKTKKTSKLLEQDSKDNQTPANESPSLDSDDDSESNDKNIMEHIRLIAANE